MTHQITNSELQIMSLSKITARIQKLINLANDNPNESEAASAMERAYKMLAKHNLSMSMIGNDEKESEGECGQDSTSINNGGPWARVISHSIAKLYFCDMFYSKGKGRKETHTFVGLEHNVALAQQIANTVLTIIHKAAKKEAEGSTPFLNSFRNAASQRIALRCRELVEEAKKGELQQDEDETEAQVGTGMVLASVYDTEQKRIAAYNAEKNPNLKAKASRARSTNMSGHQAGTAAGNTVGLRPSIK